MDIREKKTRRSITNAFLELRSKKALEKITVKELAELAEISKATFYLHYKDIYDLSEQLQQEVIRNVLTGIEHPEYCLTDTAAFTEEIYYSFHAQQSLIEILFSGLQNSVLPQKIEQELREFFHQRNPDMGREADMRLTYSIYGGYYVYEQYHKTVDLKEIVRIINHVAPEAGKN